MTAPDKGTPRCDVAAQHARGRDIEPRDYYVVLDLARTLEREALRLAWELAEALTQIDAWRINSDKWRAEAALASREGWQPIESAPKDGTEILGWREDAGTILVRWIAPCDFLTESELLGLDAESAERADWFCADFAHGSRLEDDLAPTHWLPLPEPAAVKEKP